MNKYKKTFRIAELIQGTNAQISLQHGEYETEAAAEAYLGTIDPVERAAKYFVILPVFIFPARN